MDRVGVCCRQYETLNVGDSNFVALQETISSNIVFGFCLTQKYLIIIVLKWLYTVHSINECTTLKT